LIVAQTTKLILELSIACGLAVIGAFPERGVLTEVAAKRPTVRLAPGGQITSDYQK
jgi:hypothetical protein